MTCAIYVLYWNRWYECWLYNNIDHKYQDKKIKNVFQLFLVVWVYTNIVTEEAMAQMGKSTRMLSADDAIF